MMRSRSGDRLFLALVGLALLVAGGYGLGRSFGALGEAGRHQVLLGRDLRTTLSHHAGWFGGGATFVALIVAWAAWRWLHRQITATQSSLHQVSVGGTTGGRTAVAAGALTDAIVRDLEADPLIGGARARLVGRQRSPALELVVDMAASAELSEVRRYVEEEVLPRARRVLDRPDLEAAVRLRLGDPQSRVLS